MPLLILLPLFSALCAPIGAQDSLEAWHVEYVVLHERGVLRPGLPIRADFFYSSDYVLAFDQYPDGGHSIRFIDLQRNVEYSKPGASPNDGTGFVLVDSLGPLKPVLERVDDPVEFLGRSCTVVRFEDSDPVISKTARYLLESCFTSEFDVQFNSNRVDYPGIPLYYERLMGDAVVEVRAKKIEPATFVKPLIHPDKFKWRDRISFDFIRGDDPELRIFDRPEVPDLTGLNRNKENVRIVPVQDGPVLLYLTNSWLYDMTADDMQWLASCAQNLRTVIADQLRPRRRSLPAPEGVEFWIKCADLMKSLDVLSVPAIILIGQSGRIIEFQQADLIGKQRINKLINHG
ncbi:MAG: hypothetical protein R3330_01545 [Saprospiraceae bacterium]|nr:hypothetical protein [Saprospiraceae bacterium]